MAAADLIASSKERLASLLEPIAGGVGEDISYDERFDEVKNEVEKLQSLSGGRVDWGSVASGADELLTDKSKDFRVAVYYAAARTQLDGLEGLLDGLVLGQELTASFWDAMYPALRRPKARGNIFGWFAEYVAPSVEAQKPTAKQADLVAAIDEVSRALDATLRDKLADAYPGMAALRGAIRSLVANVPKEAPPPPPPPPPRAEPAPESTRAIVAAPPAPVQVAAPMPAASSMGGLEIPSAGSISGAGDAEGVIAQCALLLARAGDAIRYADPTSPQAYRVGRMGFWLEVVRTPPAEGGQTLVPPPPDGIRQRLDALGAAENWLGVIHAADEAAAEYILWLDPHRYIANAMDRLGPTFAMAKKALLREVAMLLLRAPTLPSLAFNDGTPIADGQTKMWIETEVQPVLGAASGGGDGAPNGSALEGQVQEARKLAASGQLPEAVSLLTAAAAAAPSPAERFRARLTLAKLCLQAEHFAVARAQLEGLEGLAEQHRLADWEPGLCAELYGALYAAHKGVNRGDEIPAEARVRERIAFERLCQLDAAAAIRLSQESA